jgi:hypothetical protein
MDWTRIGQSAQALLANQTGLFLPFEWAGKTLHGCRSTMRREDINTDAGLAGVYAFSLLVPASEFADGKRPEPRTDKIKFDGREYRVLAVEEDAVAACVRIHLGDALA